MKLVIIEQRLRLQANVLENKIGFMPRRSKIEAIYILGHLMERCRENKRDLCIVYIELETAYDRTLGGKLCVGPYRKTGYPVTILRY